MSSSLTSKSASSPASSSHAPLRIPDGYRIHARIVSTKDCKVCDRFVSMWNAGVAADSRVSTQIVDYSIQEHVHEYSLPICELQCVAEEEAASVADTSGRHGGKDPATTQRLDIPSHTTPESLRNTCERFAKGHVAKIGINPKQQQASVPGGSSTHNSGGRRRLDRPRSSRRNSDKRRRSRRSRRRRRS